MRMGLLELQGQEVFNNQSDSTEYETGKWSWLVAEHSSLEYCPQAPRLLWEEDILSFRGQNLHIKGWQMHDSDERKEENASKNSICVTFEVVNFQCSLLVYHRKEVNCAQGSLSQVRPLSLQNELPLYFFSYSQVLEGKQETITLIWAAWLPCC